ncbi:MAG: hypothetical protein M1820_010092 [Bogoriella megaspora]|nr:MAG: hypothetical protein M1820_010092 [Bogoriella megaspora]
METINENRADSPTLKRSFDCALTLSPFRSGKRFEPSPPPTPLYHDCWHYQYNVKQGTETEAQSIPYVSHNRNRQLFVNFVNMPVPTASNTHAVQMPSFRSVFDQDENTTPADRTQENKSLFGGNIISQDVRTGNTNSQGPLSPSICANFDSVHQHRDSTSTVASDSTDSSPTTTISTMDSTSVATESSPGSSPQSPALKAPPVSLMAMDIARPMTADDGRLVAPNSSSDLQRPNTPARKPRNLKNLAVDTSQTFITGRKISTAALPIAQKDELSTSAPTSPSFIKPPSPPKRTKNAPLGLTIPACLGNSALPQPVKLAIPPTPSFKKPPMLRHFQSSPSLPLCSPFTGPTNGMKLPPIGSFKPAEAAFADVPMEQEEDHDDEPNFDIPQSREEKPEAYPHGPICIYESGIDLYLEPTAEIAAKYDVVLNVASEVKNPFSIAPEIKIETKSDSDLTPKSPEPQSSFPDVPGAFPITPILFLKDRNVSNPSLSDQTSSSPDTPKATPLPSNEGFGILRDTPAEYIHIPWEHNTDIVPDLFKLVRVIDERVREGKRVLVHCQCGVSRSASLIVAYGLYKNPSMTVQQAYDAVKKRSKWIGPNMNLIMQLQEFRNGLMRAAADPVYYQKVYGTQRRSSPKQQKSGLMPPPPKKTEMKSDGEAPSTAPLRSDGALEVQLSGSAGDGISPGPSSAPSGFTWPVDHRRSWGPNDSGTSMAQKSLSEDVPYVSPTGDVVSGPEVVVAQRPIIAQPTEERRTADIAAPVLAPNEKKRTAKEALVPPASSLMSPRATGFAMSPLSQQASPLSKSEFEDDLGLMSPRVTEFTTSPFGQAALFGQSVSQADVQRQLAGPHPSSPSTESSMASNKVHGESHSDISGSSLSASSPREDLFVASTKPLKPKFSRPNLKQQIQLAQMQEQLEAQLPHRSPMSDSSSGLSSPADDYETLLSPRATEFTENPFHFEISPPEVSKKEEAQPEITVPKYGAVQDPRSPAQKGITPITRNIFDVL